MWIVVQSLISYLTTLTLEDLGEISSLPDLWKLSSLQFLELDGFPSLYLLDHSFYGVPDQTTHAELVAFCNLRKLEFWYMDNWKTWEDLKEEDYGENSAISVMPRLQELNLLYCEKLEALPHRLLKKTTSLKCLDVTGSPILRERYSEETGNDREEISHISDVCIGGSRKDWNDGTEDDQ